MSNKDYWADVRERLLIGRWFVHELTDLEIENVKSMEADIERILADATALLAVVRLAANVAQAEEYSDNHWRVHHHDMGPLRIALAALPEHLK